MFMVAGLFQLQRKVAQKKKQQHRLRQEMAKKGKVEVKRKSPRRDEYNDDGSRPGLVYPIALAILGCLFGILHRNHIAAMFENDKHFSHLSTLERELAFRTEMGFYYSYFKTVIEAPTFYSGLAAVVSDNVTEYPLTINTLKRFNLYPEIVLGASYRIYDQVSKAFSIKTKVCWNVNRGEGMPPVQSCEGLGEPAYFYVELVFLINGINMAMFFFFGTYLSGSMFGGLVSVLSFFFNHGECTRVQWTPPLRENFAYPFFVMQMFLVTYLLRCHRPTMKHSVFLAILTVCFMLPWQFAQFALLTQLLAIFATYVLGFVNRTVIRVYLLSQLMALGVSFVLLFGNEMLLTSFYVPCFMSVSVVVLLERPIRAVFRYRLVIWAVQGALLVCGIVAVKLATGIIFHASDDEHIGELLRSKFGNYKSFHTMLYTCAVEFDFMETETPWRVLRTLVLPCCAAGIVAAVVKIVYGEWYTWRNPVTPAAQQQVDGQQQESVASQSENSVSEPKPDAELVYHIFQLAAFTVMAVVIMRLKLFWTPHLCLLSSLIASPKLFGWVGQYRHHQWALVAAIIAAMSVQGAINLRQQWSIVGEFSNYPLETLVDWINHHTPRNAVFAGPMPIMATVKLCTGRPIVNHPHYEDAALRARTMKVYTMFSRKSAEDVWQNFEDLSVDYAILEGIWCTSRPKPGCSLPEIWDLEDSVNVGKTPVCALLHATPTPYFRRVFQNEHFDVLQIVRPKPSPR